MHVVILAGGRGTRMKDLTNLTPKPLLKIGDKSILIRTLEELPSGITRIILIVGYYGDQIKNLIGSSFKGRVVEYVDIDKPGGTAYSLYKAQSKIDSGKSFLVLYGDDLYTKNDLNKIITHPLAIGIKPLSNPPSRYHHVSVDSNGYLKNIVPPERGQSLVNVATGAFVLDSRIFSYEPVKISNGELGLPQTVVYMSKDFPIYCETMDEWFPLTTGEDLRLAETHLEKINPDFCRD